MFLDIPTQVNIGGKTNSGRPDLASDQLGSISDLGWNNIIHSHNTILLNKLFNKKMPSSIHNTYSVDFTRALQTRKVTDRLSLPSVHTASFGKNSIRYQAICSWNLIAIQCQETNFLSLNEKQLKNFLKKFFINLYCFQSI